jgi:hypothetical protein
MPDVVLHVVVLRPQPDGTDRLLTSTDNLTLPFGGDPNRVNDYDLQAAPSHLCVLPGDHVALATSGGFGNHFPQYGSYPDDSYSNGALFQMFAGNAGSSVNMFRQPDGTDTWQVPDDERFSPKRDEELLMRVTLSTREDARWFCRTKEEQDAKLPYTGSGSTPSTPKPTKTPGPVAMPVSLPKPSKPPAVKAGKVPFSVYCRDTADCTGTLSVTRGAKVVATAPFTVASKATGTVIVKLAKGWQTYLKRKGQQVKVTATAQLTGGSTSSRTLNIIRR